MIYISIIVSLIAVINLLIAIYYDAQFGYMKEIYAKEVEWNEELCRRADLLEEQLEEERLINAYEPKKTRKTTKKTTTKKTTTKKVEKKKNKK